MAKPIALLALVCLAAPSGAMAQPSDSDAQARIHFEAGRNYNDTGDYESAAREFERAYELSHRPGLLFNLYSVEERLGRFAEAASYLERFLAEEPNVEDRAALEQRLERLRERAQSEGSHEEPSPSSEATPAPSAPRSGGDPAPLPAVIVTSVGAAALIAVAVLGGLAAGEDARLASTCGSNAGRTCTADQLATLNAYDVAADSLLGIGLAAAATGIVLWVVLSQSGGSQAVAAVPWIGPASGGAVVVGRF